MTDNATLIGAFVLSVLMISGCTPAPAPHVTIVNNQVSATQTLNGAPQAARVAAANPNGNLTLLRASLSGVKQKIDSYFALNSDCSPAGSVVAVIKSPPSHGTFVTAPSEQISNFLIWPTGAARLIEYRMTVEAN